MRDSQGIKKVWSYFGIKPEIVRPILIAEASNNHNGDLRKAKKMIEAAFKARVDAIKFQTFTGEGLYIDEVLDVEIKTAFFKGKRRKLIEQNEFSSKEWCAIAAHAKKIGIPFISTALDFKSADLLEKIGVSVYKVASMDINNLQFLKYLAYKKKPMIISTGMSNIGEIERAVKTIYKTGNKKIILLHCVSLYPTPIEKANLLMMMTLRNVFRLPVGFSDHTVGDEAALAAVAMGACLIEKHMTLNKKMSGPEHYMCADPRDLRSLCKKITNVAKALGSAEVRVLKEEEEMRRFARRSLVTTKYIKKNTIIKKAMLTFKRPGWGIPAEFFDKVVGAKALKDIAIDKLVRWGDIRLSERLK